MRTPFVSRERYDELRAAHMDLLEKYHALLVERQPSRPQRSPQPSKPPRDPMIEKIAADLEHAIPDKAMARAEAERIKREAFGG